MGELLTVSDGEWQGFPRPTYNYEWFECSGEVAAASSTRPSGCTEFQSDAKISAGSTHSCVAQADGTAYCWGASSGSFSTSTPTSQSGTDKVVQVTAGNGFTCYLLVDSSVKCFGVNGSGQIGDGTTSTRATPVIVNGLRGVQSLTAGDAFACALMIDGTVQCWGNNGSGQLGLGNTTSQSRPQVVPGLTNVISLDAGQSHACAVVSGGSTKCWGSGGSGQVGNGQTSNQTAPTAVSAITTAVSVSAGGSHTCAVLTTGGVRCWGLNASGQLGNASLTSTSSPVGPLNMTTGAASVSAGSNHTCVSMSDRTAKCWGSNASGQMGTGNTTNSNVPSTVPSLSGVSNISAGGSHTCVVQRSGSVSCWGLNTSGQIGDGTTTSPRATATLRTFNLSKILLNEPEFGKRLVSAVSASNSVGAATRYSASANLVTSRPVVLATPSISSGANHGSTLTVANGTWASSSAITGYEYQWYRCTTTISTFEMSVPSECEEIVNATTPTYVLAADDAGKHVSAKVTAIASSGQTSITTASNGPVTVPPTMTAAPVVTGSARLDGAQTVTTGTWIGFPSVSYGYTWYRCATENPTVVAGLPTSCALISGATGTTYTAVAADLGNYVFPVVRVTNSGGAISTVATTIGLISSAPLITTAPIVAGTRAAGNELSVSAGVWLSFPNTETTYQWYRCSSIVGSSSLTLPSQCAVIEGATASTYVQASADSGTYVTVASRQSNSIGDLTVWSAATEISIQPPTMVSGPRVLGNTPNSSSLVADLGVWEGYPSPTVSSQWYRCNGEVPESSSSLPGGCVAVANVPIAVSAGQSHSCSLMSDGTVSCWGTNNSGQLGLSSSSASPVKIHGVAGATSISAGLDHTCALAAGVVNCWGYNQFRQLGDGTQINRFAPVVLSSLTGVTAIAAGGMHTCALLATGGVWCWGYNEVGALGGAGNGRTPVAASGIVDATAITTGSSHSCALLRDGTVKCWGYNGYWQLGVTGVNRLVPTLVSGLTGVVAIDAGGNHTCALLGDGRVHCWGNNDAGQLGRGTTGGFGLPSAVADLNDAISISTGGDHSCALIAGGEVKCWGANGYGQIGDGSSTDRSRATVVTELASATEISAGFYHSCALLSSGTLKCTGENGSGQIGDGTTSRRLTPVAVVGYSFGNLNSEGVVGDFVMVGITARNRFGTVRVWSPTAGPISVP